MALKDCRNVELSTNSKKSVEAYDRVLDLLASYRLDPLVVLDAALAEDPEFVSGHVARAALGVLVAERGAESLIRDGVAAGRLLAARANDRERRHFAAAEAWLEGDFHRAIDLYGRIVIDYPRDLLALQVAHVGDFYLGQQRLLRDRVAQVLPEWGPEVPGYGYVLGMLAFGLEETNLFDRAEAAARQALELERHDAWSVHAAAHVYEMTGKVDVGIEWLESRQDDWAPNNSFAYHNFWHLALFELESGNMARVHELFDRHVWPKPSSIALEMVDAASLLFRLYLRGAAPDARSASIADAWSDPVYHGYYAFNDVHAVMAFVGAGRMDLATKAIAALERAAAGSNTNAMMSRDVGLPLAHAIVSFASGQYSECADLLLPIRTIANRFGGSNAQRDIIHLTLVEAALRAGRVRLARALVAERTQLKPSSPFNWQLSARVYDSSGESAGAARARERAETRRRAQLTAMRA